MGENAIICTVLKGIEEEILDKVKLALMSGKVAMRHLRPNTFLIVYIKR